MVAAVEIKSAHEKLKRKSVKDRRATVNPDNGPNSCRHRNLAQKVEPTCDPRREGSSLGPGNHGRPVIWTAAGRMCATYFWSCVTIKMPLWTRMDAVPPIAKPTNIVKKAI